MEYRIEKDTLGEIRVPKDKFWGAQTERSRNNFKIGNEKMPLEIIRAFAVLKKASAITNCKLGLLDGKKGNCIADACDKIISGELDGEFPLVVWQTGSGTQSNMNVNEVISNYCKKYCDCFVHPNDDVNKCQSSNDTFPTAMHISAVTEIEKSLLPEIESIINTFSALEKENEGIIKCGRTHLQDAVPIAFSDEISGWKAMLSSSLLQIKSSLTGLKQIALGGTAVGTGLNSKKEFAKEVAKQISEITGIDFVTAPNKFQALASKDAICFAHGALKTLACSLMKIANDIRLLSSGPRNGLGEITIPANEPGSSIMPGKVNPTQCEAITMIATQVMGNDVTIGVSASQGNFELNVFMPVIAYNFLQSVKLLTDGIKSFNLNCVKGIKANVEKMRENLNNSLMLVTALNPYLGYENCAKIAKKAFAENISLKQACLSLGLMSEEKFDEVFHPEEMAKPFEK